nr:MAG TPA: hypothetical protein [Caudoviricetes sp.]
MSSTAIIMALDHLRLRDCLRFFLSFISHLLMFIIIYY